jgi:hypothetical protein
MFLIYFFLNFLFVITTFSYSISAEITNDSFKYAPASTVCDNLNNPENLKAGCDRSARDLAERHLTNEDSTSVKLYRVKHNNSDVKIHYLSGENSSIRPSKILLLKKKKTPVTHQNSEDAQHGSTPIKSTEGIESTFYMNELGENLNRKLRNFLRIRPKIVRKNPSTSLKHTGYGFAAIGKNTTRSFADAQTNPSEKSVLDYLKSLTSMNERTDERKITQNKNYAKTSQTAPTTQNNVHSTLWKCYDTETDTIVPCMKQVKENSAIYNRQNQFKGRKIIDETKQESIEERNTKPQSKTLLLMRRNMLERIRTDPIKRTTTLPTFTVVRERLLGAPTRRATI